MLGCLLVLSLILPSMPAIFDYSTCKNIPGASVNRIGNSCFAALQAASAGLAGARADCIAIGGTLATVNTQEEFETLFANLSGLIMHWVSLEQEPNSSARDAGWNWVHNDGSKTPLLNVSWWISASAEPNEGGFFVENNHENSGFIQGQRGLGDVSSGYNSLRPLCRFERKNCETWHAIDNTRVITPLTPPGPLNGQPTPECCGVECRKTDGCIAFSHGSATCFLSDRTPVSDPAAFLADSDFTTVYLP